METVRGYLLSIVAVCMICVITVQMVQKESVKKITRFVGGLLLLLVVARPLLNLDFQKLETYMEQAVTGLEIDTGQIQTTSENALAKYIKETTQAYIEEKAKALGGIVQAKVRLTQEEYPVPCGVTLTGTLTPQQQGELSLYLSRDLGIAVEEQEWNLYG